MAEPYRRRRRTSRPGPAGRLGGRPRRDPSAARVIRSYSMHPDTEAAIDREAKHLGIPPGVLLDMMAKRLPRRES